MSLCNEHRFLVSGVITSKPLQHTISMSGHEAFSACDNNSPSKSPSNKSFLVPNLFVWHFSFWTQLQKKTFWIWIMIYLSFTLTPWKWAWHYQERPPAPNVFYPICTFTFRGPLLIMPRPLSGCQTKLWSRTFCWCIVCFCTTKWFFQNIQK